MRRLDLRRHRRRAARHATPLPPPTAEARLTTAPVWTEATATAAKLEVTMAPPLSVARDVMLQTMLMG